MALAEPLTSAPVSWGQAGTLVLTSLAIMGSPGPATISLTAAGSAYGVRRSAGYLTGIVAGTTAVARSPPARPTASPVTFGR
jgi:membrane protein DedA with SNARE-associated domain